MPRKPFPSAMNFGLAGFLLGGMLILTMGQIIEGYPLADMWVVIPIFVIGVPMQIALGVQNRAAERRYAVVEYLASVEYHRAKATP